MHTDDAEFLHEAIKYFMFFDNEIITNIQGHISRKF